MRLAWGPGRLFGVLMEYGKRARDRAELFEAGSLTWPEDGVIVNRQHTRAAPILRVVPIVDGDKVRIDAPLPDTSAGRDAAAEIRSVFVSRAQCRVQGDGSNHRGRRETHYRSGTEWGCDRRLAELRGGVGRGQGEGRRKPSHRGNAVAVTITVAELLAALRLGRTDEETAQATRLLAYATAAVEKHVPNAPATIANEAVIRLSGYLFDQPFVGRGPTYANALRNSGAAAILLPHRIHRAGSVAEAVQAADEAGGILGNPVTNVTVSGSTLTITFADGEIRDEDLPEGTGDGAIDQVARDAAAAAQATADEADIDQTARDAAAAAQTTADAGGGGTPVTGSVASTGTAVATVASRFRRVVVMAGGTINNTQAATEFTLSENIAAGEKLVFVLTSIGRAYAEIFTDDLLALATSYSAAPSRSGDGLVPKIHQANTSLFGHNSLYVFKSDEANKIWLSLGRSGTSSGRAQSVDIVRHYIDVSVDVAIDVNSVLTASP